MHDDGTYRWSSMDTRFPLITETTGGEDEIAELLEEVTRLREALVVERATAILLRDELEDYRPRVWPTRKEADFLRHTAYAELVAEKLLP